MDIPRIPQRPKRSKSSEENTPSSTPSSTPAPIVPARPRKNNGAAASSEGSGEFPPIPRRPQRKKNIGETDSEADEKPKDAESDEGWNDSEGKTPEKDIHAALKENADSDKPDIGDSEAEKQPEVDGKDPALNLEKALEANSEEAAIPSEDVTEDVTKSEETKSEDIEASVHIEEKVERESEVADTKGDIEVDDGIEVDDAKEVPISELSETDSAFKSEPTDDAANPVSEEAVKPTEPSEDAEDELVLDRESKTARESEPLEAEDVEEQHDQAMEKASSVTQIGETPSDAKISEDTSESNKGDEDVKENVLLEESGSEPKDSETGSPFQVEESAIVPSEGKPPAEVAETSQTTNKSAESLHSEENLTQAKPATVSDQQPTEKQEPSEQEIPKQESSKQPSKPIVPTRPNKSVPSVPKRPVRSVPASSSPESVQESDAKKAPPPKPKKLSSKIAAFQQMFNQPEAVPTAPQHPKSGKLSSEKIGFAANLQNVMGRGIALPGMANPQMFQRASTDLEEETADVHAEPEQNPQVSKAPQRARGPRGKRLPKAIKETTVKVEPRFQLRVASLWQVEFNKPKETEKVDDDLEEDYEVEPEFVDSVREPESDKETVAEPETSTKDDSVQTESLSNEESTSELPEAITTEHVLDSPEVASKHVFVATEKAEADCGTSTEPLEGSADSKPQSDANAEPQPDLVSSIEDPEPQTEPDSQPETSTPSIPHSEPRVSSDLSDTHLSSEPIKESDDVNDISADRDYEIISSSDAPYEEIQEEHPTPVDSDTNEGMVSIEDVEQAIEELKHDTHVVHPE
ncbi:putative altered inheritance of mitochondria protein [Clavispora lusitaniae]|uniref:Altered inheritance of mitochondria protein n=1 Tax=Clavispora lusitaniae TaxID=36911 RepID=A0ACD0WE08_CLALS|nr:putative altered inheritance of mitochondria protein [Clavispora lusitaniae]QFZ31202.1 putative altered inheritance of mitochondria protein [Clavispora lusitaniae]QFZ36870.1 putative altered inheritance of mitochondria protein [Clavispora lusitaniae]QFZ42554.1 putative altered inheritance of mitochondria protein [Clavispora lusitaniae]QFZ48230.1 putative altered inheritance of mitochondria protein [Clavispora lusitaniae]